MHTYRFKFQPGFLRKWGGFQSPTKEKQNSILSICLCLKRHVIKGFASTIMLCMCHLFTVTIFIGNFLLYFYLGYESSFRTLRGGLKSRSKPAMAFACFSKCSPLTRMAFTCVHVLPFSEDGSVIPGSTTTSFQVILSS